MKITIVTGFFLPVPPVLGGATEKIWHRLAQDFAAQGHAITFISRAWPDFSPRETVGGVQHVRLPGANHSRFLPLNLLRDLAWGMRVAREVPPADIVVCNSPTLPAWLGRVRPAAGRVVAVVSRMPKGQGRAYGRVDLLLALSRTVEIALRRENPDLASRIALFPFPIDWELHAAAASKAAPPAPITVGYVGRIHPEKGVRLLLAAAARIAARGDLPPWRLELIGPWEIPQGGGGGAYRDALLAEFSSTLGPRLAFAGPEFDPRALARRYGAIDVFCYPSLAEQGETFGVAVAEAMAAGAAPVVSKLSCFNELVRDGETGLVFDHAAPDATGQLADRLATLIADATRRKTLAARAQAHVRQYDFAAVGRTVLAQFAQLAGAPGQVRG
jgi:glycosyltransferase involved in cell wall biosynthesis